MLKCRLGEYIMEDIKEELELLETIEELIVLTEEENDDDKK